MGKSTRRGASAANPFPTFADIRPETVRGAPGLFRVGRDVRGTWWLITPSDEPVLLRAVAGVNRHGRAGPPPASAGGGYARTVAALYGPGGGGVDWARSTTARLRNWLVDTVGPWADAALAGGDFYCTATADFCRSGAPLLVGPGLRLPDVFDPRWPELAHTRAAAVAPWAGRAELAGWFTDDAPGWGGDEAAGGIGFLQACLSLEPSFAAHHAAWEFVLATRAGSLDALRREWGLADLAHREHVRQLTRAERPIAGAAFADDARRFAREAARRYFAVAAAALRAADPGRLVLGCRFAAPPPAAVRAACAWPDVDVVSWRLRAGATFAAQADASAGDMPQWVTGGGLAHGDFRRLPARGGTGPTRLERLLRAGREGLVAACRDPRTVGIEWAHWADGGEDAPPFGAGLVHADDHEAVEHTELLRHIHEQARRLHARGRGLA